MRFFGNPLYCVTAHCFEIEAHGVGNRLTGRPLDVKFLIAAGFAADALKIRHDGAVKEIYWRERQ